MSAIRHKTRFSRLDFRRLAADANDAAEKPSDSSKSFVVSRIDWSSSTIATSDPIGIAIPQPRNWRARLVPTDRAKPLHDHNWRYDFGRDRLRRSGRHGQPVGYAHESGQGAGLHLAHDLPAMNLHRHLAQVELGGDLLVRAPDDDESHDL